MALAVDRQVARLDLGIPLKHQIVMLRFDAGAVITHVDINMVIGLVDVDVNTLFPVMKCIFNQISEDLPKFRFILLNIKCCRLGCDIQMNPEPG